MREAVDADELAHVRHDLLARARGVRRRQLDHQLVVAALDENDPQDLPCRRRGKGVEERRASRPPLRLY